MCRLKRLSLILVLLISNFYIFSQSMEKLSQGESLFKENRPKEAVQVLENELLNGIVSANTYNFLGLGYYQLGEYSKSIDAFDRGIKAQPTNIKILSFNQGNTYYAMKDFTSAVRCFTTALNDDLTFYDALLNRANSLLMANQLVAAKSDYIQFVEKCPEDAQKSQIERLIQALTDEIARREEEERLLREQNKALWEEVDPSIEESVAEETQWEKIEDEIENYKAENHISWENIDATITEQETPKKTVNWEGVDASIVEQEKTKKAENWEDVDATISEHKEPKKKVDWEQIENAGSHLTKSNNKSDEETISINNSDEKNVNETIDWEQLDFERFSKLSDYENYIEDKESEFIQKWENLSDEEALELKRLEKESKLEYERWLEEQSLIRQRRAEEELQRIKQKADEERIAREKLLEDVMKAEEARRKKLLDDVANSLQSGNSTNISSGTDDLIDYDLEGELD